jgi:hypothetical protein
MIAFDELRSPTSNEEVIPIETWGNIEENAQEQIKIVSPWHWAEFNTIEEKATLGELVDKINKNQVAKLDLADYIPTMTALHRILTQTYLYSTQRKKPLPPFTHKYLKQGLHSNRTLNKLAIYY